ncbi:MAG: AAA family ATPase, partial [Ilumatobacteraceae bacterium]
VASVLSGGHLLIEDVPGVGKTLLAQVIARAIGGTFRRIQGTSDLLPGDVTGSLVPGGEPDGSRHDRSQPDRSAYAMRFRPGPVFANVVLFDELNRATPRTQSALLELAEERTVTVDGESHPLPTPFLLIATQNPIDIAGTYRLGEGALDRFAAVVSPGRADPQSELEVLTGRRGRPMLAAVDAVLTVDEMRLAREAVAVVDVSDAVAGYVIALLEATRRHPQIRLGASTRAGVSLLALARAIAASRGRSYVVADDVAVVAVAALAHRVAGTGDFHTGRALVAECLASVSPPTV